MNTWSSYADGSLSRIVLHSVPPLVVFVAAEAVTDLRDKLTDAVHTAFMDAARRSVVFTSVHEHPTLVHEHQAPVHEHAPDVQAPVRRRSSAEYLATARAAHRPGVVVTPAWVREVTGCSRGLSSRLAATLAAELGDVDGPGGPGAGVRP
jgi:hypothetical protein